MTPAPEDPVLKALAEVFEETAAIVNPRPRETHAGGLTVVDAVDEYFAELEDFLSADAPTPARAAADVI